MSVCGRLPDLLAACQLLTRNHALLVAASKVIPYIHISGASFLQPFGLLVALGVVIGTILAMRRARRLEIARVRAILDEVEFALEHDLRVVGDVVSQAADELESVVSSLRRNAKVTRTTVLADLSRVSARSSALFIASRVRGAPVIRGQRRREGGASSLRP